MLVGQHMGLHLELDESENNFANIPAQLLWKNTIAFSKVLAHLSLEKGGLKQEQKQKS